AYSDAHVFLERALLAAERAPEVVDDDGAARARLLEKAADIAYFASATDRAVELARRAVDAVDAELDPLAAARCYTLLGRNTWVIGDADGAFAAYSQAIKALPAGIPSPEYARVLAEEARGHMLMSRYGAGQERAQEAIEAARAVGARDAEGHALNTLGCCRGSLGFYDEAIALLTESLTIAEQLASPDDLNRAYGNLASMVLDAGRLDDAAAIMFDSAAVGEELWGIRLNGAAGNGVEALVRLGRYAEAERVLAQIGNHALGVCAPGPWTLPAPMMIRRGRFDIAEELVATAREMTARLEDVQQAATVLGLATELDLERDRPSEAWSHIEQALTIAARSEDETQLPELCMVAVRAIADGYEAGRTHGQVQDPVPLRRRADDIVAAADGCVTARIRRGATPTPRAVAAHAQSAAERSRLDKSDAGLWIAAADLWIAAHEPYPRAYCLWRAAEALVDTGAERAQAGRCVDEAWQIANDLGCEPLASRIVALAQRARIDLRARAVDAVEPPTARISAELGLTPREVEVLGRLAAGHSDREIAEELFISKKTVSVHVSNVLRKLSVARRFEAGKIGQAYGLG
ncbi:MAG: LuxR C-terminal-related transcriptional regulator, partial [Jatrophihabitantaceae bacterium]